VVTKKERIKLRLETAVKTITNLVDKSGYSWAINADEIHKWAVDIVNDQEAAVPDKDD